MTLKIRPIKLRRSVYFRVPSDIADLIGLRTDAEVTVRLEEHEEQYLLTYVVDKEVTPTLPLRSRNEGRLETALVD